LEVSLPGGMLTVLKRPDCGALPHKGEQTPDLANVRFRPFLPLAACPLFIAYAIAPDRKRQARSEAGLLA